MIRKCILMTLVLFIGVNSYSQEARKISDFSLNEINEYINFSYMFYGSNLTTAQLLFRGASFNRFDNEVLLGYANFFTENSPPLAMVFYYYLYKKLGTYNPIFKDSFMLMFSDAMNQYGWATNKKGKQQLTIGDIYEYDNFIFDIGKLKEKVQDAIIEFGSLENAIIYIQNILANRASFIEDKKSTDYSDYLKSEVVTTEKYQNWLNTYPEEIRKLDELIKEAKK